ncbi:hydantoinase/oxoprolinase family protein [Variovorax sp. RA8]|uniref:hydantoinase/oxoprolinase family protein n=1 Tax=Variovorax sp. (strain JCM 16519 / RA8) TaxID=662548 RepID=UPI00131773F1|nr:hydantoinase/oxoprolinase family protein [Variovorax sp. RA8]VTU41966.1 Acetophenone carboxylase gamma subunit [Variovorax sp. RA8]
MNRIGIDVGGTFTDVVLVDDASGQIWSTKVATTPADRVMGAMNGFRKILELSARDSSEVGFIGHGTTMATNMIVEGKGAKTALVTTAGFRDVLELRRLSRHDRADLYDLQFENPKPLVERRWRLEVNERMRHDGTVEVPLDLAQLRGLAERLADSDIEAVAICFLHSYVNPEHERAALQELRRLLPRCFITASHEVNPEMQEYERTSSTVMNALLGPVCGRYIHSFEAQLRAAGFAGELLFMQSNGGLASTKVVAAKPIVLLESGPAGGVSAAVRSSEQALLRGVLLGDMGGTTFDVSLVRESRPEIRTHGLLHTHAVRAPTIDIDSIGAGGGSIAWIDSGGGVHIGPESAAADPGPACYGRGGTRPTVTDCNLLLGYVDPDSFLGGEFKLDTAAALAAVETHLAKPLGVSVLEAAWTVRVVANALMAQAMRLMTVERGYDPRELAYMCYGGAGPVHAVDLAQELDIKEVIVPPLPGLFSAFGMIVADRQFDGQTAVETELEAVAPARIHAICAQLEQQARAAFGQEHAASGMKTIYRADCRYAGQPAAIAVDIPPELLHPDAPAELVAHIRQGFERNHKRMWNFIKSDQPIVLVNLRVQATVQTGWRGIVSQGTPAPAATRGRRERNVYVAGRMQSLPVHHRTHLAVDVPVAGPAIIEEQSSCIVFKVGQTARIDEVGNLRIAL